MNPSEVYTDHEVRIRVLEKVAEDIKGIYAEIKDLRHDVDTKFMWVLGTLFLMILTIITMFGGVILHLAKVI